MRFLCDDIVIEAERKAVKGMRLVVKTDGTVRLSIPWYATPSQVELFIQEHLDWIRRARQRVADAPERVMHEVTPEDRERLAAYLLEAVPRWCEIMGEKPVDIRLRNMKSQWGNCRWRERIITFNLQLAFVPTELVDYIIVHELAHLQVHNHSAAFHARVQLYIPDEVQRRRALRHSLRPTTHVNC